VRERDEDRLVEEILETAREQEVGVIVVGLPRPLSGGTNSQVASVLAFTQSLRDRSGIPVRTWDERFTSRLAEKCRPSREPLDAVAACYMLQNYLDAHADTVGGSSGE
jgi:putative transcription antitermination factor YqgF